MLSERTFYGNPELAAITKNPVFNDIYGKACQYWREPMDEKLYQLLERNLVGTLYELFAYTHLKGLPEHQGILSPPDTVRYMSRLFFGDEDASRFVHNPFGQLALDQEKDLKYSPDGIRIDGDETIIYEYTLQNNRAYFEDKVKQALWFQRSSESKNRSNVSLRFVIPEGTSFNNDDYYAIFAEDFVMDPICAPANTKGYYAFINWILTTYRLNLDSATLSELQAEAHRMLADQ